MRDMTASEQARTDAMADAETLALASYSVDIRGPRRNRLYGALRLAWLNGRDAIGWTESDDPDTAAHCARAAASAAFHAVPDLRG